MNKLLFFEGFFNQTFFSLAKEPVSQCDLQIVELEKP